MGADGDVDVFKGGPARVLVEGMMGAEVCARIRAGYGERSPARVTHRNGYRSRAWDTRVGTIDLQIPKLREGSYFPSLLQPRRRSERALPAVVQQANVEGVSTRRVRRWDARASQRARVTHLLRPRRGGRQLPGPVPGRWSVPVPVAGRADAEGEGVGQDSQRERGGGHGCQRRWQAGDRRHGGGRP